eukprot:Amastigsp_a176139_81.p3 type:complete len:153 gc:universal Amastigsp_a176139_81:526-68(-)
MSGRTALTVQKWAIVFTCMVFSENPSASSMSDLPDTIPALLIRMSIGPTASFASRTASYTRARSVTSTRAVWHGTLRASISALASASPVSFKSQSTSAAPRLANSIAVRRPMPAPPPVMSTVRPCTDVSENFQTMNSSALKRTTRTTILSTK